MSHITHRLGALLALASLLCTGCAATSDTDEITDGSVGEAGAAIVSGNGLGWNGLGWNGLGWNGLGWNGVSLTGTTLSGTLDGTPGSGDAFIGTTMTVTLSDGISTVDVHIDNIEQSGDPEILLYTISYPDGSKICGLDVNGDPVKAIPLSGRWDYSIGETGGDHIDDASMFSFACVDAPLGKCVTLGYKPWASITEVSGTSSQSISGRPLHQACTRMMRADYCGDGAAHTQNGTPINVWDNFDIQTQASVGTTWWNDAEWTEGGAACISNLRYDPNGDVTAYINSHCSDRWTDTYGCFSGDSTFFTSNGYSTPLTSRSLIRNQFDHDYTSTH